MCSVGGSLHEIVSLFTSAMLLKPALSVVIYSKEDYFFEDKFQRHCGVVCNEKSVAIPTYSSEEVILVVEHMDLGLGW